MGGSIDFCIIDFSPGAVFILTYKDILSTSCSEWLKIIDAEETCHILFAPYSKEHNMWYDYK
jgi:hypothetical protein